MLQHVGLSPEQRSILATSSISRFFNDSDVVAFACQDLGCLKRALAIPAQIYLDYGSLESFNVDTSAVTATDTNATQFIVETKTAYELPIAVEIARQITRQYHVPSPIGYELETALHEALANAIIHGNLGIGETYNNRKEFEFFYDRVHTYLSNNTQARKKLLITYKKKDNIIYVMISDEGEGFDITPIQNQYQADRISGNGRFLMKHYTKSLQYHNGGCSVELQFKI